MRIDGRFSGRITSRDGELIVGFGGRVDANVDVSVVTVQGIVNGDLIASRRIELGRAAIVIGNIRTPSLIIAPGATFEGTCKMAQQPAGVELSTLSDGAHDARQPARLGAQVDQEDFDPLKNPAPAVVTPITNLLH